MAARPAWAALLREFSDLVDTVLGMLPAVSAVLRSVQAYQLMPVMQTDPLAPLPLPLVAPALRRLCRESTGDVVSLDVRIGAAGGERIARANAGSRAGGTDR